MIPHENAQRVERNKPSSVGQLMPLFRLSSNDMPTMYIKMPNRDAALVLFEDGFDEETYKKHINAPSFKCEQITPEEFVISLPSEFLVSTDCSF